MTQIGMKLSQHISLNKVNESTAVINFLCTIYIQIFFVQIELQFYGLLTQISRRDRVMQLTGPMYQLQETLYNHSMIIVIIWCMHVNLQLNGNKLIVLLSPVKWQSLHCTSYRSLFAIFQLKKSTFEIINCQMNILMKSTAAVLFWLHAHQ